MDYQAVFTQHLIVSYLFTVDLKETVSRFPAPNLWLLLAFRTLQGTAWALVIPSGVRPGA